MLKLSKKKLDCSFWSIFRIREIRNENWKLFELEVRNVKTWVKKCSADCCSASCTTTLYPLCKWTVLAGSEITQVLRWQLYTCTIFIFSFISDVLPHGGLVARLAKRRKIIPKLWHRIWSGFQRVIEAGSKEVLKRTAKSFSELGFVTSLLIKSRLCGPCYSTNFSENNNLSLRRASVGTLDNASCTGSPSQFSDFFKTPLVFFWHR